MSKFTKVITPAIFDNGKGKVYGTFSYFLSHETAFGIPIRCFSGGFAWSENEYQKRAKRLRGQTFMAALRRGGAGINHPVYGHLNKHLLKMKYRNKAS